MNLESRGIESLTIHRFVSALTNPLRSEDIRMNAKNLMKFLATLIVGRTLTSFAAAQDRHQTSQVQVPKANKRFVTHSNRDGKSVLALSDDFAATATTDPHSRLVDPPPN